MLFARHLSLSTPESVCACVCDTCHVTYCDSYCGRLIECKSCQPVENRMCANFSNWQHIDCNVANRYHVYIYILIYYILINTKNIKWHDLIYFFVRRQLIRPRADNQFKTTDMATLISAGKCSEANWTTFK